MKRSRLLVAALLTVALAAVAASHGLSATGPQPPVAEVRPRVDMLFGREMVDPYYWLRERDNPEVLAYLEAENEYTHALMRHTEALQAELYDEMVARIKETDLSAPVKWDDYYYYTRTDAGKQYEIHCRKQSSLAAEEEILLDVNELAEGHDFFDIGTFAVSPDHALLAYACDTTGSERYALRVKDLETGILYADIIDSIAGPVEWANDNRTIFYTTVDESWRSDRLYRHRLGDPPAQDKLIFYEPDQAYDVSIGKSKSMAYIFLTLESIVTSEVHYLSADDPAGEFNLVCPREHGVEYEVAQHGDLFYIVTNDQAKNFRLMSAPVANPAKANWKEVIPNRLSVKLDGVEVFEDWMAIYERRDGLRQIRIWDLASDEIHAVRFDEPVYTYWRDWNPEYESSLLRFTYTSFTTPNSVYDYDVQSRTRELKKQEDVLGGYDPAAYRTERVLAAAPDGTTVPISMVYREGMVMDGTNPVYLYAYGAYGFSSEPHFSSSRLSLLDRGVIYAIAHVRGGGEMGRYWYEDGKLLKKKNTMTDFIAAAEYLIGEGYTSPSNLVISGLSAGGLLIGAVVNMRPDLFGAVVAEVPFVDLVNTMLDASIPLTVTEYEEWGNPNEKVYFDYMLSYSPYDNVGPGAYPEMLILAGLNDTRVQYWEPAKWTAKLRAVKTDRNRLMLKTQMEAGHGGPSGRYDRLKEIAFEYAFVLDALGIGE
jgi:oligopeptidase B